MPNPTVLMIDDDPDTLMLQEVVLAGAGLNVIAANSTVSAFDIISKNILIDLVLLDHEMGKKNSTDFIDELEKNFPEFFKKIPIVLVTAHKYLPESRAAGHIRKGIDIDAFAAAVKSYLPVK